MELTKEQALEEHRKMWYWIADQYREGIQADIHTLKRRYIFDNEEDTITHNCYCCEYAIQKRSSDYRCLDCPVIWGTEVCGEFFPCEYFFSAYQKLKNESCKFDKCDVDSELCARFARAIANLPERKCV